MRLLTIVILALLATTFSQSGIAAAGDDAGRDNRLQPFQDLIAQEKFAQAIKLLDKALTENANNADLLNLVAFCHRRLGHYEIALNYYQKALAQVPEHRAANEYLGELYLLLGQVDKAGQRLQVLDKDCFFGCDEYDQLKQAIEQYRKANPG
tara:strand:+ start:424 stop:879 length:456 start_codon:yes stop_codon:yes gene_type:complete